MDPTATSYIDFELGDNKAWDTVEDRAHEREENERTGCHGRDIFSYVTKSIQREDDVAFAQLESLHRLNITNHQVKLVRLKSDFHRHKAATSSQLEELTASLAAYSESLTTVLMDKNIDYVPATAIRDYQFLQQHQRLGKYDADERTLLLKYFFMREADFGAPYQDTYLLSRGQEDKFDALRRFLIRKLPVQVTYTAEEKELRKNDYMEGRPPRKLAPWLDHFLRSTISLVGGVFVVAPMLIMSFSPSQTKSLVVISSAVAIFGLVVSLGIRVSSIETLVATATYAAVLVVFVGSTTGNGNASS